MMLSFCFRAPRVQHLMRWSPSANNFVLEKFDNHLRLAVTSITHSALSSGPEQCQYSVMLYVVWRQQGDIINRVKRC